MKEDRICVCGLPEREHKELKVKFVTKRLGSNKITDFKILQAAGAKNGCIAFRLEEARLLR